MAIVLVTYDLKAPGKDYKSLHAHLKTYTYCKGMESVWLLDTSKSNAAIRDGIRPHVDTNDVVFVSRLHSNTWASVKFSCADWLNRPERNW
jgi:hypothetical protein